MSDATDTIADLEQALTAEQERVESGLKREDDLRIYANELTARAIAAETKVAELEQALAERENAARLLAAYEQERADLAAECQARKRAPWREIVSRESYTRVREREQGRTTTAWLTPMVRLKLSCGHEVERYAKKAPKSRVRCEECLEDESGDERRI